MHILTAVYREDFDFVKKKYTRNILLYIAIFMPNQDFV